jgi:flagellar biosynthetic protein FliQ
MHKLIFITQEALLLVILVSTPVVLVALAIGFSVAVFQATTQIHETSMNFAPKMVATLIFLGLLGPWIGSQIYRFTFNIFDHFPELIR